MKTNLATQARPQVITRKQARKSHMEGLLRKACQEAILASVNLKPGKTAWVYLVTTEPGKKAHYTVEVSRFPHDDYPPEAGYQGGKLAWTPASAKARTRS